MKYRPEFKKTVLDNGIRVVTERHPYAHSVQCGFFVNFGSRDEPQRLLGGTHFLEHLVWKRTKSRSAYQLVKEVEELGGEANAYTGREHLCHHASSLGKDIGTCIDILSDIMWNAEFSDADFNLERDVILQEIDMTKDDLSDYAFDYFFEKYYATSSLGRPILGTPGSLKAMTKKQIVNFYHQSYTPDRVVIAAAGDVDHDLVIEQCNHFLPTQTHKPIKVVRKQAKCKAFVEVVNRESEQVHVLIGLPSSPFTHVHRFDAYVINALLGGGMTSKLYQAIREEKGWAYSVFSLLQAFVDSGTLIVYAACAPENVVDLVRIVHQHLRALRDEGPTKSEIEQYKTQVSGEILLNSDDYESRMNSLAVNEILFGEYRDLEKVLKDIKSVNADSVNKYLKTYFDLKKYGILIMGDVNPTKTKKQILSIIRD